MASVEFINNGNITIILCRPDDKMEEIIKKYILKTGKDINLIYFLYNGEKIDEKMTFTEQINDNDKKLNKMTILVMDKGFEPNPSEKISKYIICPTCEEYCRIFINRNFKIKLYDCKNQHKKDNILLREFESTQKIDESKIKCNICEKLNKKDSFNNIFYFCIKCGFNICPLCKMKHDKSHNIIDYDKKNFICYSHNELYNAYCQDCKKDICLICEKEHNNHKIISYSKIIPNKDSLEDGQKKLRQCFRKFTDEAKKIINKLNDLIKSLEIYDNIYDNIIKNYEIKNRNYIIIQNINNINNYNKEFIENLNEIIVSNEIIINDKLKELIDEFDKNKKDISFAKFYKEENDNSYNGFNFDKYKYLSFKTKAVNNKLILLNDGRLLSLDKNTISVYNLQNNNHLDIFECIGENIISEIIKMDNGLLLFYDARDYKIININKKQINIKEIYFIEGLCHSKKLYKLSNGIILSYGSNSIYFNNGTNLKLIKSFDTKKDSVYDICEVKKNEIAFICSKEGKIYGKYYYLIFYDYEKDNEIYSKKLNNKGKLFIINENNLIFAEKNKLMLMNLKDYNFVNEIEIVSGLESFLALNHKFFLCFFPGNFINAIYHYEIEKDNLIEKGSEWGYKYKYAIKYGDKLISCSDNEIYLLFHNY